MLPEGRIRLRQYTRIAFLSLFVLITYPIEGNAQGQTDPLGNFNRLSWSTDSTGPRRFVSVHGRRAAIFGYPQGYTGDYSAAGLEVWAYPVQILRSYCIAFRKQGETTSIDGQTILRRVVYSPEAMTRIYAGPDFIVHEKLFVPLDEAGAIIRYEVESVQPIDIEIRFIPVLDLMWPASIGGQEAVWSSAHSAYLLSELTHRYTAVIGSTDIVAHDATPNISQPLGRHPGMAFTLRAGNGHNPARVIIAGGGPGQDASALARNLLEAGNSLEKAAVEHYVDLLRHALEIETPDSEVNRALAWSEIALDQAWVCNPDLGCGTVAGYGPSRKARRPQYDWFFAGDGMVAIQALLAAGEYERARQELEFILKYQDQTTGMIWHELSQSAGVLDWKKYSYMFVHVELTFDFLDIIRKYFSTTGDREFVKGHWSSIRSAYEYCQSLLDAKDGLPRIPEDKEGEREQDALTDELALSVSWAKASHAFGDLSFVAGDNAAGTEAVAASQKALRAIRERYWDARQQLWIAGHTRSGTPLIDRGIGPVRVNGEPLLSEAQSDSLFKKLAASDFEADWGMRGNASTAATYDPNSYSNGSVWAISTAGAATEFWVSHRGVTALAIWSALIPWNSLDSLGHMHEVMAGDTYHEEIESVPEQTWSSASFFTAAVNGLLGLQLDGATNRITFAPHLPPSWNGVTLRNVHLGASEISFKLIQSLTEVSIRIQNEGAPVEMAFDPEIPFGAKLRDARLGASLVIAQLEEHPRDTHAKVEFHLPHGNTSLTIRYAGGVAIIPDPPRFMIGESSQAIKISGVSLQGSVYTVDFDYSPSVDSGFEIRTPWIIKDVQGAIVEQMLPALYRLTVRNRNQKNELDAYQHGTVVLTLVR